MFIVKINNFLILHITNVGVYFPDTVFLHGQRYVALSRGISRRTTKVLVKPVKEESTPQMSCTKKFYVTSNVYC